MKGEKVRVKTVYYDLGTGKVDKLREAFEGVDLPVGLDYAEGSRENGITARIDNRQVDGKSGTVLVENLKGEPLATFISEGPDGYIMMRPGNNECCVPARYADFLFGRNPETETLYYAAAYPNSKPIVRDVGMHLSEASSPIDFHARHLDTELEITRFGRTKLQVRMRGYDCEDFEF